MIDLIDHRHGDNEPIKGTPRSFYEKRPFNERNLKTWEECNFGILCNRCNFCLPTRNRAEWLLAALDYDKGVKS